jgi:hypothetical protein
MIEYTLLNNLANNIAADNSNFGNDIVLKGATLDLAHDKR